MEKPVISLTRNGPYRVEGLNGLRNSHGEELPVRQTMFLCRCGRSQNKPFCDGTHWDVEFRDPRN